MKFIYSIILFLNFWLLPLFSFASNFEKNALGAVKAPSNLEINFDLLPRFNFLKKNEKNQDLIDQYLLVKYNDTKLSTSIIESPEGVLYAEGTGMRGGGSGILRQNSKNQIEVVLLDSFRSENADIFPAFYKMDTSLKNQNPTSVEDETEQIYNIIRDRINKKFPSLGNAFIEIEKNMPFNKWTISIAEFPIIDDYIGDIHLNNGEKHVQVASRHLNQIIYNELYYKFMDAFNRAALRLHEYIYILSGNKNSIYTQILVSYLMSKEIQSDAKIPDKILEIYLMLGFSKNTPQRFEFPKGVVSTEEVPDKQEICGSLKSLKTNNDTKEIDLTIQYDMENPQLSRQHVFNAINELNFNKEINIEITDPLQFHQFLKSFLLGKFYLSNKFPLYLFPAQSSPFDIICINKNNKKISSIEMSIGYNPEKNSLELERAELESQYFSLQRKYVLKIQSLKQIRDSEKSILDKHDLNIIEFRISTLKAMLAGKNLQIQMYSNPLLNLQRGMELGGLRLKFN